MQYLCLYFPITRLMLSEVPSLLYGGNVWRQLSWETESVCEACCYSEKGFEKVLFDYLCNFWIAALQKRQASLTSALSRCHFASSGDVDQSSNSGSYKYYFSWLQNCWIGSDPSSLVRPSQRDGWQTEFECIQLLLLLAVFSHGESREALSVAKVAGGQGWAAEAWAAWWDGASGRATWQEGQC